jgi:hypothetical protein
MYGATLPAIAGHGVRPSQAGRVPSRISRPRLPATASASTSDSTAGKISGSRNSS